VWLADRLSAALDPLTSAICDASRLSMATKQKEALPCAQQLAWLLASSSDTICIGETGAPTARCTNDSTSGCHAAMQPMNQILPNEPAL
jgi:hypothetical protein